MNKINLKRGILTAGLLLSASVLNAVDVANPIYLYKGDFTSTYTISSPGYYLITEDIEFTAATDALVITTSHVTVDFNTHALYSTESGLNGIEADGVGNITIKNGTISGFGNGIYLNNVTSYDILNCTLMTSTNDGIEIDYGLDGRIVDCNSIQNGAYGLDLAVGTPRPDKLYVKNSHFDNNDMDGVIQGELSDAVIFEDCTCKQNTLCGMRLYGSNILRNCISINNGQAGFIFSVSDAICESCTALENMSHGFYLSSSNAQLIQCKSNNNGEDGIYLTTLGNVVITECSCFNNTGTGIENNSATSIIVGNKAGNNTPDYGGTSTPISTTINRLGDNDVPPISDYTNIETV